MRTLGLFMCAVLVSLQVALALTTRSAFVPPTIIVLPVEHTEPCWNTRQLETYRGLLDACHGRVDRCLDLLEIARDAGGAR